MRLFQKILLPALLGISSLLLSNCQNTSNTLIKPGTTGPFDRNGNYIDSWANSPNKWGGSAPRQTSRPSPISSYSSPTQSSLQKKTQATNQPRRIHYTVRRGDNLSRIASRHNVSISAIKANNRMNSDVVIPGQTLIISR